MRQDEKGKHYSPRQHLFPIAYSIRESRGANAGTQKGIGTLSLATEINTTLSGRTAVGSWERRRAVPGYVLHPAI